MEIEEAFAVLREYYTDNEREYLYRNKKYDRSETDTIRQHEYNAELLMKKVIETNNEEERTKLRSAAETFKNLAMEEWCNS